MALENYESVAERIEKWWNLNPMGRVATDIIYQDGSRYIIRADLYRDKDDLIPYATDFAEEIRSNTNRFPLENACTSALGRAMHTGGLSKFSEGVPRPSLEEMKRVERLQLVPEMQGEATITTRSEDHWTLPTALQAVGAALMTGTQPEEAPLCKHGHMVWKEGVNSRTNKPYKGWVCSEKSRESQCEARWQR